MASAKSLAKSAVKPKTPRASRAKKASSTPKASRSLGAAQTLLPGMDFKRSLSFGGSLLKRSHAKDSRPLSSKQALHIVLRSDHATGRYSLLRHERVIQNTLKKIGRRHGVKIYRVANAGNHLHLLVRFTQRRGLQNFLRGACGIIARKVLGAERGRAMRPQLAVREARATVENISRKLRTQLSEEARLAGDLAGAARIAAAGANIAAANGRALSFSSAGMVEAQKGSAEYINAHSATRSKTPELRFTTDAGRFWSQRPFTRIVSWGKDFDSVLSYLKLNTLEAMGFLSHRFTRALPSQMIRSRVLAGISRALGYG